MWYVYDKATTVIQRTFKTSKAAKGWITRKQNEYLRGEHFVCNEGPLFDWGYADAQWFHQYIEKQVVKKNLMSGKEFTQPANTPRSCDPSTETYWSM